MDTVPAAPCGKPQRYAHREAHFGTSKTMQQLLENEGFTVVDDMVLEFRERVWDPAIEYRMTKSVGREESLKVGRSEV
jgi:hypothetical protein